MKVQDTFLNMNGKDAVLAVEEILQMSLTGEKNKVRWGIKHAISNSGYSLYEYTGEGRLKRNEKQAAKAMFITVPILFALVGTLAHFIMGIEVHTIVNYFVSMIAVNMLAVMYYIGMIRSYLDLEKEELLFFHTDNINVEALYRLNEQSANYLDSLTLGKKVAATSKEDFTYAVESLDLLSNSGKIDLEVVFNRTNFSV